MIILCRSYQKLLKCSHGDTNNTFILKTKLFFTEIDINNFHENVNTTHLTRVYFILIPVEARIIFSLDLL